MKSVTLSFGYGISGPGDNFPLSVSLEHKNHKAFFWQGLDGRQWGMVASFSLT